MGFCDISRALLREVRAPRNQSRFEQARGRHPALASHDTVMSVLGVLADRAKSSHERKDAITRALVEEQQADPQPFWLAILLLAFAPMLQRLRSRVAECRALARTEVAQVVTTCFLDAVETLPTHRRQERLCLRLRQNTERLVFQALNREEQTQRAEEAAEPEDIDWHVSRHRPDSCLTYWPDGRPGPPMPLEPWEVERQVRFFEHHTRQVLNADERSLLVTTFIHGVRLPDYVLRHYPDLSAAERNRVYEKIKRRHSRALARLRRELARWSCPEEKVAVSCTDSTHDGCEEGGSDETKA